MKPKSVTPKPEAAGNERWIIAKAGNVEIPAYRLKDGRVCISYYEAGERKRRTFVDEAEAKREAGLVAASIRAGQQGVLQLTNADRESYLLALSHLEPFGMPLHAATEDYAKTRALLPAGVSLRHAVEFYLSRNSETLISKPVSDVVSEFLEVKEQDGASSRYLGVLKNDLKRFSTAFEMPVSEVTGRGIEAWMRGLNVSPRSRNNLRAMVITLFNFAKGRGYLPRDRKTEAEFVPRASTKGGNIHIFTPDELAKLLQHADEDSIPFIALSAFAGLRHAEVLRLEWRDIRWAQNCIEIGKEKSKTATRRLVPLLPNLAAWLAPYREREGQVCRYVKEQRRVQRLAESKKLGIEWHQNVLRHSFISYRVAATQNVAQVALEAGNSAQVIFSNYREVVTPSEAEHYFGIMPEKGEKLTPIAEAA